MENTSFRMPDGSGKIRSSFIGAPNYLMQADILNATGSQLAPRSDSFTIRAYGESLDINGNVVARAWCEAVVQRTTELEDGPDEQPMLIANPDYVGLNTKFGSSHGEARDEPVYPQWIPNPEYGKSKARKMRVVSFRWLNSSEV